MKKLIILSLFAVAAFTLNAQSGLDTGYDYAVGYDGSVLFYTGTAADTLGTGDSTWTKTVLFNTMDEIECNIYFDIDSVGGTSAIANRQNVYLQAKAFPDDTYTNIDTVTYQGTADTTFTMSISTAGDYRYVRVNIVGDSDELGTEIQKLYFHKIISR